MCYVGNMYVKISSMPIVCEESLTYCLCCIKEQLLLSGKAMDSYSHGELRPCVGYGRCVFLLE